MLGIVGVAVFVLGGVVAVIALVGHVRHASGTDHAGVPISAALVAADGRHLTASATVAGCAVPELSANESRDAVTLTFTATSNSGYCQLTVGSRTATARVVLDASVFGKHLVDSATGRPVKFFDGRTLHPVRSLPPGWRLAADIPGVEPPGALAWTREYGNNEATMHVEQCSAPVSLYRIGAVVAEIPIKGRRVPLYYSDGGYEIWWGSGRTYFAVDVSPTGEGAPAMTIAEVEQIVTGLAS